jgi:hypothetical protein
VVHGISTLCHSSYSSLLLVDHLIRNLVAVSEVCLVVVVVVYVASETDRERCQVDGIPKLQGMWNVCEGVRGVNVSSAGLVLSRDLMSVVLGNGPVCLVLKEASSLLV